MDTFTPLVVKDVLIASYFSNVMFFLFFLSLSRYKIKQMPGFKQLQVEDILSQITKI